MKRVKETLAVLFLSLVLGSCGSLMDNNILLSIHKGMTQEEVTKLLGRPDYRRFDEQGEQWEYRKGGGIGHYGTTILIDFKNNLVSNGFFESVPLLCMSSRTGKESTIFCHANQHVATRINTVLQFILK